MKDFTQRQMILVASASITKENFTMEDIVANAFAKFPDVFHLRGYEHFPDSNKVHAKVCGVDGLLGLGWLERTATNCYVVTKLGKRAASVVMGEAPPTKKGKIPPNVEAETPEQPVEKKAAVLTAEPLFKEEELTHLSKLLASSAYKKYNSGSLIVFFDAKDFWSMPHVVSEPRLYLDRVQALLERVPKFRKDGEDFDSRIPLPSVARQLTSLHEILQQRFSRELFQSTRR